MATPTAATTTDPTRLKKENDPGTVGARAVLGNCFRRTGGMTTGSSLSTPRAGIGYSGNQPVGASPEPSGMTPEPGVLLWSLRLGSRVASREGDPFCWSVLWTACARDLSRG